MQVMVRVEFDNGPVFDRKTELPLVPYTGMNLLLNIDPRGEHRAHLVIEGLTWYEKESLLFAHTRFAPRDMNHKISEFENSPLWERF